MEDYKDMKTGGYCAACLHSDDDCICSVNLLMGLKDIEPTPIEDIGKTFVYVVNSSSGSWDSHHRFVTGVFDNLEDAEELANKLDKEAEEYKSKIPDEDSDEFLHDSLYYKNPTLAEWNVSTVEKVEMNTNLYK